MQRLRFLILSLPLSLAPSFSAMADDPACDSCCAAAACCTKADRCEESAAAAQKTRVAQAAELVDAATSADKAERARMVRELERLAATYVYSAPVRAEIMKQLAHNPEQVYRHSAFGLALFTPEDKAVYARICDYFDC